MIASKDMTWDMIAYNSGYSEFSMDSIMAENPFEYSDIVTFDGGENIKVPTQIIIEETTIKPPWEK